MLSLPPFLFASEWETCPREFHSIDFAIVCIHNDFIIYLNSNIHKGGEICRPDRSFVDCKALVSLLVMFASVFIPLIFFYVHIFQLQKALRWYQANGLHTLSHLECDAFSHFSIVGKFASSHELPIFNSSNVFCRTFIQKRIMLHIYVVYVQ